MNIAVEIEVEAILEIPALERTGFDLGNIHAVSGEAGQHAVQAAGAVGQREGQADLVRAVADD